jgi:hypothetical protein
MEMRRERKIGKEKGSVWPIHIPRSIDNRRYGTLRIFDQPHKEADQRRIAANGIFSAAGWTAIRAGRRGCSPPEKS